MLAKLHTFALLGIDAVPVEVEVDAAPGQIKTILVGLPEMAVRESVPPDRAGSGQPRVLPAVGPDDHQPRAGKVAEVEVCCTALYRVGSP